MKKNIKKWLKEDRSLFVWMPTYIWAFVVFTFSVLPFNGPDLTPEHSDKIYHFIEFAVLAMLISRSLSIELSKFFPVTIHIFTLILSGMYGILMELLQIFVPGRCACFSDLLADFCGVLAGLILGRVVLWRRLDRLKD